MAPVTQQASFGSSEEMRVRYSTVLVRYVIAFALAWMATTYYLNAPKLTFAAGIATCGILAGIALHHFEKHLIAAVVWLNAVNLAVALGSYWTPPEGNVSILFIATATAPFAMFSGRTHRSLVIFMVSVPVMLWLISWGMNIGSTRASELAPDIAAKVLAPASAITVFGTILFVVGYLVRQTRLHARWLIDAQQQALKSSEAKSALMRSVSHEMLTPLHAISGYAELLNTDAKAAHILNPEQVERHTQQILTSSHTLRQIIENIFDFANWQSEKAQSEKMTVPVLDVFETVRGRFLDTVRNKGLTLNTRIDGDLYVEANPVWTASVFKQVLDNAVKYSNQDGTIDVSAQVVDGGMVEILFKDDGPGFPKGTTKNAFDAFERLGHETGTTSGVGVGLPMAQNFATAMGGQIVIDETVMRGAAVRVLLPQALYG